MTTIGMNGGYGATFEPPVATDAAIVYSRAALATVMVVLIEFKLSNNLSRTSNRQD